MRLIVTEDYAEMSRRAARLAAETLRARPEANVIMPTGSIPEGFYRELAALHRQGVFDARRLRVFQLDEYLGVGPDDPRSFFGWIRRVLLEPLGIAEAQVARLRGEAPDPEAACREYDAALRAAGGCDLVVLGLGRNGHLGFNEPPADPMSPTHVVQLSEETRASNARYWGGEAPVPEQALTCGMANILGARAKLLLVSGAEKREALRRAIDGRITPEVPASYLQASEYVTLLADANAWPRRAMSGAGRGGAR